MIPGKSVQADLILPEAPKAAPETHTPANTFENPTAWTIGTNSWWVHAGPGYSFLRGNKSIFAFEILKGEQKGMFRHKPKVTFVVDYHSDQDRILYTLDDRQLHRKVLTPSGDSPEKKINHGMETAQVYRIVVDLETDRVIIRGPANAVLDEVKRTSPGKFGFEGDVSLVMTSVR